MSKPAYWIVFVSGKDSQRFSQRAAARAYAATQRLLGHSVIVRAVGF